MSLLRYFKSALLGLALMLASASVMAATPGCVGKMWNPLADIDFRLMGGIKIVGIPLMKAPKHLGEPPNHKVSAICFCKNGWKTGFGLGLLYWLPTYLADVARTPGCVGFLDGINILPGFRSLASAQEYNIHSTAKEGITNMQIHWAYADITAIAGNQMFESCDAVNSEFSLVGLTEIDFIFQNDMYSAIMTPHVSILASNAMLSQMTCGIESIANTLGGWQDYGVCGWKGTRLPLSANSTSKDMAQVSNIDVLLKYLTRQALIGAMLRTMGKDTACKARFSPFYDPFQHRYQWAFPARVSTRYNVDVVRWGMFIKPEGSLAGMTTLTSSTGSLKNINTSVTPGEGGAMGLASTILKQIPKPLNYPTREAGYMHVWEAKTCCLMVLTIETVVKKIISMVATQGSEMVQLLYKVYNYGEKIYKFVQDPIGGALSLIGDGIATVFESAGNAVTDFAKDLMSTGAVRAKDAPRIPDLMKPLVNGPSAGIAASLQRAN